MILETVAIIDNIVNLEDVEVIQGYIAEKNKWKLDEFFMTDYVDLAIKYGGYTSLDRVFI